MREFIAIWNKKVVVDARVGVLLVTLGGLVSCTTDEPRNAPALELDTLDGETMTLEEAGAEVVLVNFWASWCAPCRQEMPELEAMYQNYQDQGLTVWGISVDALPENARHFADEVGVTYPLLLDEDMATAEAWDIRAMPSTFVIDAEGDIRHTELGYAPETMEALEERIRALLAQGQGEHFE